MQIAESSDLFKVIDKMCGLNKLFLAPEVLQKKTNLSGKTDVYSVGVILYSLVATDLQDLLSFD